MSGKRYLFLFPHLFIFLFYVRCKMQYGNEVTSSMVYKKMAVRTGFNNDEKQLHTIQQVMDYNPIAVLFLETGCITSSGSKSGSVS